MSFTAATRRPARLGLTGLAVMGVLLGATATPASSLEGGQLQVTALSSRPATVSGDDALIRVGVPASTPAGTIRVEVGGRDVTSAFRPSGDNTLTGLVKGLSQGTTSSRRAPRERNQGN